MLHKYMLLEEGLGIQRIKECMQNGADFAKNVLAGTAANEAANLISHNRGR